jgi:hypothetical protein
MYWEIYELMIDFDLILKVQKSVQKVAVQFLTLAIRSERSIFGLLVEKRKRSIFGLLIGFQ